MVNTKQTSDLTEVEWRLRFMVANVENRKNVKIVIDRLFFFCQTLLGLQQT